MSRIPYFHHCDPADEQEEPVLCEVCPDRMEAEDEAPEDRTPCLATRCEDDWRNRRTARVCDLCADWLAKEAEATYDAAHEDDGFDNDRQECEFINRTTAEFWRKERA